MEFAQHGSQQFPCAQVGRRRHDGAFAGQYLLKQLRFRNAQAGRAEAETIGQQNFHKGTRIMAEAGTGCGVGLRLRKVQVADDVIGCQFAADGKGMPHQAAESIAQPGKSAETKP